jgi:hypothetical protein
LATLSLYAAAQFTVGAVNIAVGSRGGAYSITVDGQHQLLNRSLATSTTWDAWESGAETAITDFDFLWVLSDQNVLVEMTADKAADVGTVVFAQEAQANVPLMLTSDDCMANHTADFATGTADVIDRIRIRNVSGSTATIQFLIVT